MSVIGWIVLGLIAGIVAKSLLGGRAKHGVTVTILVGIAGALVGGWAATEFLDLETTGDFFDVSTLIAIVGAVVLLLIHHAITNRGRGANRRSRRGRGVWPARR